MAKLKTATGTDEIGSSNIALLMPGSDERDNIEKTLKDQGFDVHCFRDDKEYRAAAICIQFGAALAQGATSKEVGMVIGLAAQPGKYCLVNGNNTIIDMLGLRSMVGYCLEPGYSREDLLRTVRKMLRES